MSIESIKKRLSNCRAKISDAVHGLWEILPVVIALLVIIIMVLVYKKEFGWSDFFPFAGEGKSVRADWGTMGDFFGGVLNPLLSFIALLILMKTLKINSEELKASREELKLTRDELEGSRKAVEEQVKTAELQRFENTFFSLMNLYREEFDNARNDIFGLPYEYSKGIDTVGIMCYIAECLDNVKDNSNKQDIEDAMQWIVEHISSSKIYFYLNILMTLVEFLVLNNKQDSLYARLFISSCSNNALLLILCFFKDDNDKKKILEDFVFFRGFILDSPMKFRVNITSVSVSPVLIKHLVYSYDPKAFGNNPSYQKFIQQYPKNSSNS